MKLTGMPNSAEVCSMVEYCSGVATRQALDCLSRPQGILQYIIDIFTFGGVRRENAKSYEALTKAMTDALVQGDCSDDCKLILPEQLVVNFSECTIIFRLPGETHNAGGPVTIVVRKGTEKTETEMDKEQFCRIATALLLRHKGGLPITPVILTDDNHIDLRGGDFSSMGLHEIDLSGADMSGANLNDARLSSANLRETILSKADLRKTWLHEAALTGANLSEADLRGAYLMRGDLSRANLQEAKLKEVNLNGANLNGADLSNSLDSLLKLPKWSRETLDTHINHVNNYDGGSLLTMMDSIDDRHADVKLRMARELMTSLKQAEEDLSDVAQSLMDILSKPPYTDDAEINTWLGSLCERYLSRYNGQVLPVNEGVFNQSVDLFTRRPELMSSHNGNFIQIIAQGMAESGPAEMKAKAAALYATYLQQEPVKPYCSLEDFGDGEGKPDWADKYTANFILLSAQPATVSAMLLSQASLEAMLRPQPGTEWHNVYLYKDGVKLSPAESPAPDELFARAFPLFNGPYQHMQNKAKFLLLVKTLNLGSLDTTFVSATRVINSEVKLVSAADQKMLKVIFAPKLTYSPESGRYGLNDLHYEELVSAYGLTSASAADKGKTLLCLAALFTKYSSVAIFGTETESPEALRHYAYALMAKAHSLDESLLKRATFTDWTNRLLGLNGAFSCTAVLSYDIVGHIRSRFPATLAGIMPPAWR